MRAWVVRAGRMGERESFALDHGVVVAGWQEVGDLSSVTSREDVRAILQRDLADLSEKVLVNHTGQLWAFSHTIENGDLMVLPCKTTSSLAIGEVTGPYRYVAENPPDARHTRPVDWKRVDIPRVGVGQDLLYSLGSALTVFQVKRNNGVARLSKLLETGRDPGAVAGSTTSPDEDEDEITGQGDLSVDIAQIAADGIQAHMAERFAGHRLAALVDAILQAEGYTTRFSPPGPDGGIDVLAGSGPLGLDSPRIAVQVKSSDSPVDVMAVRDLQGAATTVNADTALLVAWAGLNKPARDHVKNLWFNLRVWTAQDVIDKATENYDALPAEIQADLPLKKVWTLALDEE